METPRRRWFQFRLSTWFVLVGVLCWALACWPWIVERQVTLKVYGGNDHWTLDELSPNRFFGFIRYIESNATKAALIERQTIPNPALIYPSLALLAFIAWKVAWLVVERRRTRAATICNPAGLIRLTLPKSQRPRSRLSPLQDMPPRKPNTP